MALRQDVLMVLLTTVLFGCGGEAGEENKLTIEALSSKHFTLAEINGQPVVLEQGIPVPGVAFDGDGQANGHAGCNRFFGALEINEGQLRIAKMGMTKMLCPQEQMAVEDVMTQVLSDWASGSLEDKRLQLNNTSGSLIFVLTETWTQ